MDEMSIALHTSMTHFIFWVLFEQTTSVYVKGSPQLHVPAEVLATWLAWV